jgi:hypothetical protein
VGSAFGTAGFIYLLGFIISMGIAALIKLMYFVIHRSEQKKGGDIS